MSINIKIFLAKLTKRKSLNYDLLEESREVEGYPELNKLLNLLSKDEEFNKLLNPLEFKN